MFSSFLQRGVEWSEDLVEVSWLGINGGLGPGGLDRWEAVRNLDPQSRLVASQSGQQSARWSNQVGEQQTTRRLHSCTCEEPTIKARQEDHEVQCHNLPSLVTASVHLDFQVRRQMNPITLTSGGNDFPIYGPGRACGQ